MADGRQPVFRVGVDPSLDVFLLACIIREAAEEWFWGGAIAATRLVAA